MPVWDASIDDGANTTHHPRYDHSQQTSIRYGRKISRVAHLSNEGKATNDELITGLHLCHGSHKSSIPTTDEGNQSSIHNGLVILNSS